MATQMARSYVNLNASNYCTGMCQVWQSGGNFDTGGKQLF